MFARYNKSQYLYMERMYGSQRQGGVKFDEEFEGFKGRSGEAHLHALWLLLEVRMQVCVALGVRKLVVFLGQNIGGRENAE